MFAHGCKVAIRFASVILQLNTTVLMTRDTVYSNIVKQMTLCKTFKGQPWGTLLSLKSLKITGYGVYEIIRSQLFLVFCWYIK